jgi:hypothetical protein
MNDYLSNLMTFGAEYAYRQLALDLRLNWRGISATGRDKALAALIGFASR